MFVDPRRERGSEKKDVRTNRRDEQDEKAKWRSLRDRCLSIGFSVFRVLWNWRKEFWWVLYFWCLRICDLFSGCIFLSKLFLKILLFIEELLKKFGRDLKNYLFRITYDKHTKYNNIFVQSLSDKFQFKYQYDSIKLLLRY